MIKAMGENIAFTHQLLYLVHGNLESGVPPKIGGT